jgi:homoserine trans-succinylase
VEFCFYQYFYKIPLIKKDLLARMQYTEEQVVRLIRDLPEKDKMDIMALLNQRGRNTNKEFMFLIKLKLELL